MADEPRLGHYTRGRHCILGLYNTLQFISSRDACNFGGHCLLDPVVKYAFHRNVLAEPVGTIPAVLFSFFQLVFQATVCAIAVGGACERGRILPLIPFIFVSPLGESYL